MKKILILSVLFIAMIGINNAQDYTISKPGVAVQILSNCTLASAGADTVDLLIKTSNGIPLKGTLQVVSANISGTSEGYVDLYGSNYLGGWEVSERTAADTLTSANLVGIRTETAGYTGQYVRLIITNKAQAQSTVYNAYIYPVKPY